MMREEISDNLVRILRDKFGSAGSLKALVIGGSDLDPEVINVRKSFETEIFYAGIESEPSLSPYFYLDLNSKGNDELFPFTFELIMCNQVFEHLFDVKNALMIISSLCNERTVVWIDFPTSTFPHGSPHFYTSGIIPDMIEKLALQFDLKTINSGVIGSKRDHLFGHVLNVWPSLRQRKHPFWSYYGINGSILKKLFYQFRIIPEKIVLATTSNKTSLKLSFSTTGWIIMMKNTPKSSQEGRDLLS
jgi:hypothetical protein